MLIHYSKFDFSKLPELEFKRKKDIYYANSDFGVDIEVTSFYDSEENKRAYPYIMMVNVCGNYIYCRYLTELRDIFHILKQRYRLTEKRRIIMFVHNLAYEFQFFRDICRFEEVFARTPRKPMKAFDVFSCIEFRCSYILSGLGLAKVGENLKIPKINGDDFNYDKMRHSKTPLTDLEMKYCERDVEILHYYVQEELKKNDNNITKIPLTQTGYIRRECRDKIFAEVDRRKYHDMILKNTPNEDLFILLNKTFMGGDTHGNYLNVDRVKENVYSFDFASSYPAVMVKCKFPTHFTKVEIFNMETFENLINKKACVFKMSFEKIKAKRHHHILSFSKCETCRNINCSECPFAFAENNETIYKVKCKHCEFNRPLLDNGRVVEASYVTTFFTDVDFKDFREYYEFENPRIIEFYYSNYEYLPTPFVKYILELFKYKTTLDGLEGELNEALYLKSKQFINGLYGMCVTNIVNDIIEFNNDWSKTSVDITAALNKYKANRNSFLLYQWGVWVTSYARHFLRETIAKIEDNSDSIFDDFIYCDTDSIKMTNYEKHKKIIDDYNKQNIRDMQLALRHHGIDENAIIQKKPNGKQKILGVWENETNKGAYKLFKTLGAKRYMYYDENKLFTIYEDKEKGIKEETPWHLTVSGLNKKKALPYIIEHGDLSFFKDKMYIPREYTGKNTHTYIDDEYYMVVTDYLGNEDYIRQHHYIHLESQDYQLSIADAFEQFLIGYAENGQPYEADNPKLRIRTDF